MSKSNVCPYSQAGHHKARLADTKECAKALGLDLKDDNVRKMLADLWDKGQSYGFYYGS